VSPVAAEQAQEEEEEKLLAQTDNKRKREVHTLLRLDAFVIGCFVNKIQTLFIKCWNANTVKPVLYSHTRKHKKWLLKAGGCLTEVKISTKLTFGNILFGCLRQVGCLIEVTANTGLTVYRL